MDLNKRIFGMTKKNRTFAPANNPVTGLIWIRQQVLWDCKHAECCEYSSLILILTPYKRQRLQLRNGGLISDINRLLFPGKRHLLASRVKHRQNTG